MAAREQVTSDVRSDTAPLHTLVAKLLRTTDGVRWLRDPTRGGVATVLAELARAAEVGVAIDEAAIPIRPEVRRPCEALGISPLHVPSEGRLIAVAAADAADRALAALRSHDLGSDAAIIAEVTAEHPGKLTLGNVTGDSRAVEMLAGDQPRGLLSRARR